MDIVRNCINIVGITSEKELPKKVNGQLIETSQAENLFIDDSIRIKNIYQIIIDISLVRTRVINSPMNRIVVADFNKKFKIAYYDMDGNMGILELNSPYNTFFDLESNKVDIEKININVADAYFELVNSRTLYNNIIYIIDVQYLGNLGNRNKLINFDEESNEGNNDVSIIGIEKENDKKRFIENKGVDNKITDEDDSHILDHVLNEISISEEKQTKTEEERLLNAEAVKNELLDMEDEYI